MGNRCARTWAFRSGVHPYTTTVFFGALDFVLLNHLIPNSESNRYIGMAVILQLRLIAMHFGLKLPVFRMRGE